MIRKTKLLSAILALSFCAVIAAVPALAETEAANIFSEATLNAWGDYDYPALSDDDVNTYVQFGYGDTVNIKTTTPVAGIYLRFYLKSSAWTVTVDGQSVECGQNGFIHEYVDLTAHDVASDTLSLSFPRGAGVCELALYTEGELPDSVQVWELPADGCADLLMFSSHADDEQLFFSGVLPDAVARGAAAQVVYFCDHSDQPQRVHEQLNGLWAVGVRHYPVLGDFPDLYSESGEAAKQVFAAQGYTDEDFLEWQVENIRRFRPQILVIHDEAGEYGHGTHILNSETAREAVGLAADSSAYPFSVAAYGTWDTPKVYMHLYGENEIVIDFDRPLDYFGGKSAYEMSCLGFAEHKSQHWTWFYNWMYGEEGSPISKASEIEKYSPCRWGLWRSTVGADTKPDMFENIVLYPRDNGEVTEQVTDTEAPPSSDTAPVTTAAPSEPDVQNDTFRNSRVTKILMGCAAAVIVGMIIALIASGLSSRRKAREAKRKAQIAAERAGQQARQIREAREARSRQSGQSASGQSATGKGASREAQIQAAREAREHGTGNHSKPTDKKY